MLIILLDNAIKFTPSNGTIRVELAWDVKKVSVSIRDTGIGISQADILHVFDRFYKADKSHHQTGTGLGLSIAREILHKMNPDHFCAKPARTRCRIHIYAAALSTGAKKAGLNQDTRL